MSVVMNMKSIAFVSLLLASTAHADPAPEATRYLQTSVLVGGAAPVVGPNALLAVDGGYRLGSSPLWFHAVAAYGPAADDQGTGSDEHLRVGVEARACRRDGLACAMVGLDAGAQQGVWRSSDADRTETVTSVVVVPRIGVDAGGEHIRVRAGLELAEGIARNETVHMAGTDTTSTGSGPTGIELGLGIAYQW